MKSRWMLTLCLFGGLAVFPAASACAADSDVEAALASYSDTSTFYAALLNTGVLNELRPGVHYTIFAPTNEALAAIKPSHFPCFYSTSCRAQVADVLRDHIVVGRKTLKELVREGEVPTIGQYRIFANSPYVGDYTIADRNILSGAEIHGNMIYRIDGVIMTRQQLAQFRAMPPMASAAMREKTIITYRPSDTYPIPGGNPAGMVETVTEKTYVPAAPRDYPDEEKQ